MCPSNFDTQSNLTSASIIATKDSQEINAQLKLICTIKINYNLKPLAIVKKLANFKINLRNSLQKEFLRILEGKKK